MTTKTKIFILKFKLGLIKGEWIPIKFKYSSERPYINGFIKKVKGSRFGYKVFTERTLWYGSTPFEWMYDEILPNGRLIGFFRKEVVLPIDIVDYDSFIKVKDS